MSSLNENIAHFLLLSPKNMLYYLCRMNESSQEESLMSPITRPLSPDYGEQSREESLSVQVYQEMKRKILRADISPVLR